MSSGTSIYTEGYGEAGQGIINLIQLLQSRVAQQPERLAYTFLLDGEGEESHLTYGELERQAQAVAASLQELGLRGERVILLYPPGLEYIVAFWGCLYAGAVAVPAYPPRLNRNMERLQAVVKDAQPSAALTNAQTLSRLMPFLNEAPTLRALKWLATDEIDISTAARWREPQVDGATLAFLQYTSGSTAAPKGVMVSHGNLLYNERLITRAFGQSEESVVVGWLPLYHDMGLIGNVLQPLYVGARCVLMSPIAFLQKPLRWLQAISRYRATTSGGPNFAYDLCVRKINPAETATLDLSCWSVAFNGAEPVLAATLERFATAFEAWGFRREAFYPCYGLAEATLLVSGGRVARPPILKTVDRDALADGRAHERTGQTSPGHVLVGCGASLADQRVLIVNPDTLKACADDEVGEVWVCGPSVASGYWNRAEETESTFRAYLVDAEGGPFLRTGDLGFASDGELFITGRLKDLIIIRGRNLYPHDIEHTAHAAHGSLRFGGAVAFSVDASGEEELLIVLEADHRLTQGDYMEVVAAVRQAVTEEHEVQPRAVILVKAGGVPKTSSGKLQRGVARQMFLTSKFEPLYAWYDGAISSASGVTPIVDAAPHTGAAPRDVEEITAFICSQLASRLGVDASAVGSDRPLTYYGMDSLMAVELTHAVETWLGVTLPAYSFLQSPSAGELAAQAHEQLERTGALPAPLTEVPQDGHTLALSYGQQALWFIHRMAPESAVYNVATAVRIRSELDAPAMRNAFENLLRRHPALRTTFPSVDNSPVQLVQEQASLDFEEIDAARWDERAVTEWLGTQAHRPFKLDEGALLRVKLLALADGEHILLMVAHHIIIDFWSLAILLQEVGSLYEAERHGTPLKLTPPQALYADYVRKQALMLEGREGERLWQYWRARLEGTVPSLNLQTDHQRPPLQTYSGASHAFSLDAALTHRLKSLGQEAGATLYMLLLSAFQALLYRYTAQEDFAVGSPAAGRDAAAFSRVVGYFVNPLVMRAELSGNPTFAGLLERVRRTVIGAFEHQDYPFALLVQRLQPERDASRSPLFQVMFVLQQTNLLKGEGAASLALGEAGGRVQVGGMVLESVELPQRVAQFDLKLSMAESGGALLASFEYNTDLFDRATIGRMAGHFETLLRGVIDDLQRRLSELPLLTAPERQQLLVEWNDTSVAYDAEIGLHRLIERQVARTPSVIAVKSGEEVLTYEELNQRANQLARRLRSLGAGPESLVGVLMERSIEMVVALLASLKAGAAYVPFDPSYPQARLAFMLGDARPSVLLAQSHLLNGLPAQEAQLVCLDAGWSELDEESGDNLEEETGGYDLAYVIYTSGSTGQPKGAMNTHRGVVNRLLWMQDAYGLTGADSVLQKTPFSFDVSVWEFFWPLMIGARLVIARPGGHQDPAYLADVIERERITTLHFVPSMLQAFLPWAEAGRAPSLRRVICSGEALAHDLQERFYERLPSVELHNLYGPTEAAVDVTYWHCQQRDERRVVPIGRPIANTEIYILDRELNPVPAGVAGELYIGGAGLGRGYLRRVELTAEKFVPHPFGPEAGARLYRTGDLARFLAGGEIEFLGRIDHQVKVRGLRIELGEIEAALAEHEAVRECVVVAREDAPGDTRLVAYLVSEVGKAASMWRRFLREKLPEYMVPSAFVTLDELPLLPNGKVDRRALPAPHATRPELEGKFAAPHNQIEEVLAGIWAEVLGVEQPGIHDNFFDLGGHSLLATQVVSRIHDAFKIELPLRLIFETPTAAGLAERLSATLAGGREPDPHPIKPAPRESHPPLSVVQRHLWFLDQLEPGNIAYNIPVALRLSGTLDEAALERSVAEIVRRHEALRTTFADAEGHPVQVVAPPGDWRLPVADMRGVTEEAREAEALGAAYEEAHRPFDLAQGPLLRARLLRLSAEEHMLLLTMHHIVSDGWSIGVFVRELTALYEAFSNGEASPLPELPIQYADYSQWQRARIAGEFLDEQLNYWKRQLGGELPVVELPSDRPRPPNMTFRGATELWSCPPELSEQLKAVGQRRNTTLFMTLMSAFQTLLQRYTGLDDVIVGTPIAGRTRVEAEGLIGFFANTLVIRTDLSGDPTFEELLARVREVTLDAHANQEVPFEMLVEELQPTRDLSHAPLFQVMMAMQNAPLPEMKLGGVKVSQVKIDNNTSKFDLIFFVGETGKGLEGSWEYNTDCLDRATIKRMAGHFETLLRGVVDDPQQRLSELPLLTAPERRQLLVEWNETEVAYPENECLHHFIEAQARLTPHAIALVFGHERWTYRELNRRANQLAHYLRSLGVGPESLVAVMMERTGELIVALLGILKAGGAYVPLDAAYPRERLRFMLEDTHASILLTQSRLLEHVPAGHDARVVCLDADWAKIVGGDEADLAGGASDGNLAYVIYTSGSTGRPKGVAITHRSAATFVRWAQEVFDPAQLSGVLASTSVCFDLSVFEIFVPLSVGGKVILAANALELPSLAAEEVTLVNTVPSAMAELVREGGLPGTVRTVNLAGEALQNALAQRVYESGGVERVLNLYGPSEDTTYSTWALIEKGSERVPPIGRPVANTRLYVLDGTLGPVPVGVAGELYIGGSGLARGYLNRPELTAERFIPDPFAGEPGQRLYRTGDLVRYIANGQVEYLGRLDRQLKLRGFRIELGEIDAALCGLEEVQEAAVVPYGANGAEQRLIGYVVMRPGFAPTTSELRRALKEQLPAYMIPNAFIVLDKFPLTPNGKIDRGALPAPEQTTGAEDDEGVTPRTPVEEIVAGICADVLGLERVSVTANFFDLGGHSLIATQIVSRVREAFGVELLLRTLFESPTIGDMAERVDELLRAGRGTSVLPIRPVGREGMIPASFAQQRLWILDQLEPDSSLYNIPAAVRLQGALNVTALELALVEIVRRHEVLRTTFKAVKGQPVQVIALAADVALHRIDLRGLDAAAREAAMQELSAAEAKRPFDLSRDLLLRAALLQLGDEDYVMLLTMHHIVSDGWSMGVFIEEFTALYQAFREGSPSPLPPLPVQYADFAVWQKEWMQGEVLERQLSYWKKQLGNAPPQAPLATDRARPAAPNLEGTLHPFALPEDVSRSLKAFSRQRNATLFMTLLAAFKSLIHYYSGQHDLLVGTPVANRNLAETETLIGFFVNTLVMRTDMSGNPTFGELLGRVREVVIEAHTNQDLPFEKLVAELQSERDLNRSPFFNVWFVLQNAPMSPPSLPGLTLTSLPIHNGSARHELKLDLWETPEGLTGSFEYKSHLFTPETIARISHNLEILLRYLPNHPDARLDELRELLAESDRRQRAVKGREFTEARQQKLKNLRRQPRESSPDSVT